MAFGQEFAYNNDRALVLPGKLGQKAFVNNLEYPIKDLNGTHTNVGQEIHRDRCSKEGMRLFTRYFRNLWD